MWRDRRTGENAVGARTRTTHGLSTLIDPEGHSHAVAREWIKFSNRAGTTAPENGIEIERQRAAAGGCRLGRTGCVAHCVLRDANYLSAIVNHIGDGIG